ncbi:MAG: DNA topoisomerase I, partial [Patescibacteria group bacterium]
MKILIVESKTKARTIAKFLKGFYIVATLGHLFDLPKKEFGIYLENGKLKAKYLPIKGKNKIIQRLKNLISKAKEIYVASDPDREGEMIAQEIKMLANKNNLKRIVFHEITKNALLNALKNPTKIRKNLVLAQKSRRFLDRIIGYSLSPLLWKSKIGESAGRVQSAALKLIVLREKEIENFKEKIFYRLIVNFGDFKAIYFENKNKFLFEDKNYLEKIKNDLDDIFLIEKIEKRKNEIKKPTPLDTALLERLSFLKFKIPSYLTMKIAQSLYERGLITYPRTDSFYLSPEFLKDVKNFLKDDYEKPLMKKSKFSQEAHEA